MLRSYFAVACLVLASSVACIATPAQHIGGVVSGLTGSVTLTNNGTDSLDISANGNFQFPKTVNTYDVEVATQPQGQSCTVAQGQGVTRFDPIWSVAVTCVADANAIQAGNGDTADGTLYGVGGNITGLTGSVTLQLNSDFVTVTSPNTTFAFPKDLISGASYTVAVSQQPYNQTCTFTTASGAIKGASVNNLTLSCVQGLRHVSFSVTGSTGPVTILNNGGDAVTSTVDGSYTFATALTDGSKFNVTVLNEPVGQACVVPNGYGTLQGTDITGIQIACQSPTANYTISGIASGLTGNVVLNNAGIENITVNQAGVFTFPTPMTAGSFYNVTIVSQPAGQACNMTTVSGGVIASGAQGTAYGNVNTLHLNCATGYTIGGAVSGLASGGKLRLINNGNANDVQTVTSNASYVFAKGLNSQSTYNVQVMTEPANQNCILAATAIGTIGASNVTTANITCTNTTVNQYTIGGNISGLNGNMTLSNNGVESLVVVGTGTSQAFTFPSSMVNASPYRVSITSAPSSVSCSIGANVGTVSSRNVTGVAITCVPAGSVTVPVSGLIGTMSIENSIGATAVISANGTATLPGVFGLDTYMNLTVASAPSHQRCVILHGSGSINSGSLTPAVLCGASYAFVDGQNANIVIGQNDFLSRNCSLTSTLTAGSMCNPYGDAFLSAQNELFVSDSTNNRVLGFAGLPPGNGASANLVLGQTTFATYTTQVANTGLGQPSGIGGNSNHLVVADTNNNRVLIYTPQAQNNHQAAAVVVGQPSFNVSTPACTSQGMNAPQSAIIVGSKLLVADSDNNRVLVYNTIPTANNQAADLVIGQPNLNTCASHIDTIDGNTLTTPTDVWSDGSTVLVADSYNNRVLVYGSFPTSNNAYANLALGQQNLKSSLAAANNYSLVAPTGVTSTGMQVFVADSGNNRVLVWGALPSILSNGFSGQSFDHVLGQPFQDQAYCNGMGNIVAPATLCTPSGVTVSGSHLIVTDTSNSRYVVYEGF